MSPDAMLISRRNYLLRLAAVPGQRFPTLREQPLFVGEYLDLPRMRTVLNRFHENVAADRTEADLLYNYTFGGASAIGRMLRKIAP